MPDTPYMATQVGGHRANSPIFAALIDVADVEIVGAHLWSMNGKGYAMRKVYIGSKQWVVYMHRELLGLTPNDEIHVDHINGDTLDNRRANLRTCTRSQNQQNRQHRSYRGVSWHAGNKRWQARTQLGRKTYNLGYYDTPEEAAAVATAWRREHMPYSADARNATKEVGDES